MRMRQVVPVGLAVLVLVQAGTGMAGPSPASFSLYTAQDGSWSILYPGTWEVVGSGPVSAFLGPAVHIRGGQRFRPSLVVSVTVMRAEGAPSDAVVQSLAREAFERGVPGARFLGSETLTLRDGRPLWLFYYHLDAARGGGRMPALYFVLGVVLKETPPRRVFTMIGTTSPELADYRRQAAQMRAAMASLQAR